MTSLPMHLSSAGRRVRRTFSQRAQAAILSVALVLSATFPAGIAVGQEQDQGQEGIAAPEQTAPPDSSAEPDFDPGGETALPFEVGVPGDGGADDSGDGPPVDVEPVTDPDAPAVPLDDPSVTSPDVIEGTDEPVPPAEAIPPAEPVPPTPPPAPTPVPAPPPVLPAAPPVPPADTDQPRTTDRAPAHRAKRDRARKRQRVRVRQRPAVRVTIPTPAPAPASPLVATTATEPAEISPATEPGAHADSGRRTHTVQRGESLWTIASALLDDGATNAKIATKSKRLYRLNRDRIGANPNMLIAGTVLRLP